MKKGRASYKWNFAIGTTSRVPFNSANQHSQHYLIADFDGGTLADVFRKVQHIKGITHCFVQKTEHGWHLYTDLMLDFTKLILILHKIGADKTWVEIGRSRGYFFLADKSAVFLPWPVERMIIHAKKETVNS